MTINVDIEGMETITWDDLWPRRIKVGSSEGWCGGSLIITITKAFSTDEDIVFRWMNEQDVCQLFGVMHLDDGRDLIIFDRLFVKQTREEAVQEHQEHVAKLLRRIGVHGPTFTAANAT